jgi:hypothetical protein
MATKPVLSVPWERLADLIGNGDPAASTAFSGIHLSAFFGALAN